MPDEQPQSACDEAKPRRVRRVWSRKVGGYTYDGKVLSACQCYPLCKNGQTEREQWLKEGNA